ncbi:hypothetical protein DRQ09_06620 [candidate division KSB1 bacterium]|nr:MAG: hypothetical protein DRQ09_06620 [candidate division KSB1 bacterium]
MAILFGVCYTIVSKYVNEIQQSEKLLPTRGNIQDISGTATHK